jgi:hypothetical protein
MAARTTQHPTRCVTKAERAQAVAWWRDRVARWNRMAQVYRPEDAGPMLAPTAPER